MTVGKETMGEQPIFTCKAHVFHIDPKTKRSWMSASSAAVSVSFFYDSSRNLYRIISVEGTKGKPYFGTNWVTWEVASAAEANIELVFHHYDLCYRCTYFV
ncbi:unnamed protein product [Colias eurytheme]|nr:unnamed protein product [Colias eurytheme]